MIQRENIQWCFFDLGSTLIDETAAWHARLRDTIEQNDCSEAVEYLMDQMNKYAKSSCRPYQELTGRLDISPTPWRTDLEQLYPQTTECLASLHNRYSIGVIANQVRGTRERLLRLGILSYIDLLAASDEVGSAKPDSEIFSYALRHAGISAQYAVMIGDRIDNDIRPAKALGFQTIWIRQGLGGLCPPCCEAERPDGVVSSLDELETLL